HRADMGNDAAGRLERGTARRCTMVAGPGSRDFRGRPRGQSGCAKRRSGTGTIRTMKRFTGIYTPIVTPFRSDDTLDEAGLVSNVTRWMKTSLDGLVVLGSNGEAAQ